MGHHSNWEGVSEQGMESWSGIELKKWSMVEPSEMEDTEGEKPEVVMAEEVRDWPGGEARDSWG